MVYLTQSVQWSPELKRTKNCWLQRRDSTLLENCKKNTLEINEPQT